MCVRVCVRIRNRESPEVCRHNVLLVVSLHRRTIRYVFMHEKRQEITPTKRKIASRRQRPRRQEITCVSKQYPGGKSGLSTLSTALATSTSSSVSRPSRRLGVRGIFPRACAWSCRCSPVHGTSTDATKHTKRRRASSGAGVRYALRARGIRRGSNNNNNNNKVTTRESAPVPFSCPF